MIFLFLIMLVNVQDNFKTQHFCCNIYKYAIKIEKKLTSANIYAQHLKIFKYMKNKFLGMKSKLYESNVYHT